MPRLAVEHTERDQPYVQGVMPKHTTSVHGTISDCAGF